jgi:hypothetical protein
VGDGRRSDSLVQLLAREGGAFLRHPPLLTFRQLSFMAAAFAALLEAVDINTHEAI